MTHPILDVFERINVRAPFTRPRALEIFCGPGTGQTMQYAPMCEYLEGWDVDEQRIAEFKKNIPKAKAKICDVYKQVPDYSGKAFNVIAVDNFLLKAPFEHFDLFPGIFNLMDPRVCFVILTVCPDPFGYAEPRKDTLQKAFGSKVGEFMVDWDAARDRFYSLPPLDPNCLPKPRPISAVGLGAMEDIYREKFEAGDFQVPYTFSRMRSKSVGYVLIEAHR